MGCCYEWDYGTLNHEHNKMTTLHATIYFDNVKNIPMKCKPLANQEQVELCRA